MVTSSIGHESGVFLKLADEYSEGLLLEFQATGFVYKNWKQQKIEIVINGNIVDILTIKDNLKNTYQLEIPPLIYRDDGILDITFRYKNAVKPSNIGASNDSRLHAINMIYLKILAG